MTSFQHTTHRQSEVSDNVIVDDRRLEFKQEVSPLRKADDGSPYPLTASFTRRVSVYCRNWIALPPRSHQIWAKGAWKLLPVAL